MTSSTPAPRPISHIPILHLRLTPPHLLPPLLLLLLLYLLYLSHNIHNSTTSCTKSLQESQDYFCEPSQLWYHRKLRFITQQLQQNTTAVDKYNNAKMFWMRNYEAGFGCALERRVGDAGDGGKWVCDPGKILGGGVSKGDWFGGMGRVKGKRRGRCLVYSFGSNNKFGFERGIWEWIGVGGGDGNGGCEVHTFDHTVRVLKGKPGFVRFHKMGLGGKDDVEKGVYSWGSIRRLLGHDEVFVEVLKVDIEGDEYEALLPVLEEGGLKMVRQLLIEVHMPKLDKVPPKRDEKGRVIRRWDRIHRFFELLYMNDWVIFHKEPNLLAGGTLIEYAFIRLNWGSVDMVNRYMKKHGVGYIHR